MGGCDWIRGKVWCVFRRVVFRVFVVYILYLWVREV